MPTYGHVCHQKQFALNAKLMKNNEESKSSIDAKYHFNGTGNYLSLYVFLIYWEPVTLLIFFI